MKAFLLYCLFLFPFSYAITKDSYMEQNSTRCHSSAEQDTLYIETEKAEFEIIYRLCLNQQGRKNVVYELKTSDDSSIDFVQSYMVNGIRKLDCFVVYDNVADGNRFLFYPIYSSADFSKGEVLLINGHSHLKQPNDTVSIDSKVTYVPFNRNNRIIKAKLVPYTQVEKDKIYQTTEDQI